MISIIKSLLDKNSISKNESISNKHIYTLKNVIIRLSIELDYLQLERIILCKNDYSFSEQRINQAKEYIQIFSNKTRASSYKDALKNTQSRYERVESRIKSDIEITRNELSQCKELLSSLDKLINAPIPAKLKENYIIIKNIILELMVVYELVDVEYNCDCLEYVDHQNVVEIDKLEVLLSDIIALFENIVEKVDIHEYYDKVNLNSRIYRRHFSVNYVNLLIDNRFKLITQYFTTLKEEGAFNDRLDEIVLLEKKVELLKTYRKVRFIGRKSSGSA